MQKFETEQTDNNPMSRRSKDLKFQSKVTEVYSLLIYEHRKSKQNSMVVYKHIQRSMEQNEHTVRGRIVRKRPTYTQYSLQREEKTGQVTRKPSEKREKKAEKTLCCLVQVFQKTLWMFL